MLSSQLNGTASNQSNNADGQRTSNPATVEMRELLRFKAQLCEHAGRFDDMVGVMNELCQKYTDLTNEERDLLSCAYKNVIGFRRTSWRILNEVLSSLAGGRHATPDSHVDEPPTSEHQNGDATNRQTSATKLTSHDNQLTKQPATKADQNNDMQQHYNYATVKSVLDIIEDELKHHCGNIIEILSNRLIPSAALTGESKVFFYKMKGDYLRYLCEISSATVRKEKSNESLLAYKTASDKAMVELPPTHPIRLGLMLNFSVFYYDIIKSPERSCKLAKQAFDDAIAELDTLSEESYRDSTIIMQLLRDNLNLWESEQNMQTAID